MKNRITFPAPMRLILLAIFLSFAASCASTRPYDYAKEQNRREFKSWDHETKKAKKAKKKKVKDASKVRHTWR